jgi:ArsR family metal-binding transcriptional regulator
MLNRHTISPSTEWIIIREIGPCIFHTTKISKIIETTKYTGGIMELIHNNLSSRGNGQLR